MKKNKGFQIKVQWDRLGEDVEIFSFATEEEESAFVLGIEKGNGWDAPTWEYLNNNKEEE